MPEGRPHAPHRHRFEVLDGLRGVAAIMVAIYHTGIDIPFALLAVDFFFMLSGFVLAHAYSARLESWTDRRRFALARLLRIYPLYLLACALALPATFGMAMFGWEDWTYRLWLTALLTSPLFIFIRYGPGWELPLNPPGWSLAYELLANAVYVLTGGRLAFAVAIAATGAILLAHGVIVWDGDLHRYQTDPWAWTSMTGYLMRVGFAFFGGTILFHLWQGNRLPRVPLPAVVVLLAMVALCAAQTNHHRGYVLLALFAFNPALIWIGASTVARGAMQRLCRWLGDLSYGIYVLHAAVIMSVEGLRFLLGSGDVTMFAPGQGTVWIAVPLAVALAHIATYGLDFPLRRKLAVGLGLRRAG